jgi:hypothetical protein
MTTMVVAHPIARRPCSEDTRMDAKNRQDADRHDTADATREEKLRRGWDEIMEGYERAEAEGHGTTPLRGMNRGRREADNTEFYEYVGWRWNVDRAKEIIGDRVPRVHVDVSEAYRHLKPNLEMIDEEHVVNDGVDLTQPLIGLVLRIGGEESLVVIEGWDRVYRARHDGIDTLPVRILTPREEREIRLEGLWDLLDQ